MFSDKRVSCWTSFVVEEVLHLHRNRFSIHIKLRVKLEEEEDLLTTKFMILCGVIVSVITERDFESGYNLCWGWKKSPHASKLWYAAVPCLVLVPMFDWLCTYIHKESNNIKRLPQFVVVRLGGRLSKIVQSWLTAVKGLYWGLVGSWRTGLGWKVKSLSCGQILERCREHVNLRFSCKLMTMVIGKWNGTIALAVK